MCRNRNLLDSSHPLANFCDQCAELRGNRIADSVRNIERDSPGFDDRIEHLEQELGIRAGRVFRRKLYVIAKRACQADGVARLLQALLARNAKLVLQMDI